MSTSGEQRADSDHDVLLLVAQRVQEIHSVINGGDGQPGIRQRTESLERWRSYITGALAVVLAVVMWIANLVTGSKSH